MLFRTLLILLLVLQSTGFRHYQDRIPNGDQVPHPCKPNFVWRGVGHLNPLGGGDRNPFGLDFAKHDKAWTKELCEADSDGDGMSNGEELGDPHCTWRAASDRFPERSTRITHPGVCDPWDSLQCKEKNADIKCDTGEFICPAVHESHVRNFTIRFPRTLVPAEETSYMCMSFDLNFPNPDQEYHIIGTEPVIDNPNVMHHIVLTDCLETATKLTKPKLCYMSQDGCFNPIGLWTLGMPGECIYKEAGIKVGGGGKTTVMMQFHWTNPERVPDYYDESGMIIYYTPKLRTYNAGLFITGQTNLEIPPGQERVTHTSTCSSDCTQRNVHDGVLITTSLNHMHYLGVEQNVEQYRNDKKIADLAKDDLYSYDNPVVHLFEPPHPLLPGDRLETTCVFRSLSRTRTTYFGEGTYDEMCYSIFTVFPIENVTGNCISWGSIEQCNKPTTIVENCDQRKFRNMSDPHTVALRRLVLENCNFFGKCRQECPAALAKAREDPCLQGEVGGLNLWGLKFSHNLDDIKFLAALSSCDCPLPNAASSEMPILNKANSGVRDQLNNINPETGLKESNSGRSNLPCIFVIAGSIIFGIFSRN